MNDIKNMHCKTLFLLAGYRASGKTSALRMANARDDLMLFNPSSMADFKRVRSLDGSSTKNSGFHSLKTLEERHLRENELVGIHYDMLLPLQAATNERFVQAYSRLIWRQRTPDMMVAMIRELLDSGTLYNCIRQNFLEIMSLAERAEQVAVSIIQSDWATNKSDWLQRAKRTSGLTLKELQLQPRYSFNLAIFHTDPELGRELYHLVYRTWYGLLDQSGIEYMRVSRCGVNYDCKPRQNPALVRWGII